MPEPAGGPWTSHGHSIPGVTVAGSGRPPVARCGGPRMCKTCAQDVVEYDNPMTARPDAPELTAAERQRVDRIEAAPAAEESLRERVYGAAVMAAFDLSGECPKRRAPRKECPGCIAEVAADAALAVVRGETS